MNDVMTYEQWLLEYAEQLKDSTEEYKRMCYQEYLTYQRAYREGRDL